MQEPLSEQTISWYSVYNGTAGVVARSQMYWAVMETAWKHFGKNATTSFPIPQRTDNRNTKSSTRTSLWHPSYKNKTFFSWQRFRGKSVTCFILLYQSFYFIFCVCDLFISSWTLWSVFCFNMNYINYSIILLPVFTNDSNMTDCGA